MLKTMLLIGAAAVSFPALAQDMPAADETSASAPMADGAAPMAEPDAPAVATPDQTPAVESDARAAQPKAVEPAANPAQIAQIVGQEFPTYDVDASAELNETEFAAWMKKLRTATDPTVDPDGETVKTWIGQAYAAADADKSGGVSQEELTGFLSRGA